MVRMVALYPMKIGVLTLLFWYLLRGRAEGMLPIVVALVLAILFHIAIVALLTSRRRIADAKLLKNSLRGEVPRDGRRIAVSGTIEATGDLLSTPFGGAPCVLYSYEIYRMVSTRSSSGTQSSSRKVVDFSGLAMAPAAIRSSNGRFALCGFPYLTGQMRASGSEPSRVYAAQEYVARTEFARTLAYAGELAALDRAMATAGPSIRLDCRMTDGDDLQEARLEEDYVSDGSRVCALGVYSAADHALLPGRGAEERIRLIAGEGAEVHKGLKAGARTSQVLATVMVLIVGAVLGFAFWAPPELIARMTQ